MDIQVQEVYSKKSTTYEELIDSLKNIIEEKNKEIELLHQVIKELKQENLSLRSKVEELERRLKLDSHTSSKPPASDGLRKKPRLPKSLREKSERGPGGQKGHTGNTLKQVAAPDDVVMHPPEKCERCKANLDAAPVTSIHKRQVFDLPPLAIKVTEHQVVTKCCLNCKGVSSGKFPPNVSAPTQYGQHLQALIIYLKNHQLLPEERLSEFLSLIPGVTISQGTIHSIGQKFADQVTPHVQKIAHALTGSKVKHVDETGFRVAGSTCWLHVLSNRFATYYRTSKKRGDVPGDLKGAVVHDHFRSYERHMPDAKHIFCNAHHLRELKALIEYDNEHWAKKMFKLLQTACHIKNLNEKEVSQKTQTTLSLFFDKIIQEGLFFHKNLPPPAQKSFRGKKRKRPGHNLLLLLQKYKEGVLAFLEDKNIPFTNNLAERDLRMMKVKQKISGGFRTNYGAEAFCKIRSFISTVKKQGLNVLKEIAAIIGGKRNLGFIIR